MECGVWRVELNEFFHQCGIRACALFAKGLFTLMGGLRSSGRENLPETGAFILASNHTSVSDPVGILATSPRLLHYMAAAELYDVPHLGKLIDFLQAFPVHRGENDVKAIAKARELLSAGNGVVIYPEGQLTRDGYLGPFYDGALLLALRAHCPVVPVVMIGFDKMLPLGGKRLHFARKEVRYGKPLVFDFSGQNLKLKEQVRLASQQLRRAMVELGAKEHPDGQAPASSEAPASSQAPAPTQAPASSEAPAPSEAALAK